MKTFRWHWRGRHQPLRGKAALGLRPLRDAAGHVWPLGYRLLLVCSTSQFLLAQFHQQVSHGIVRDFINGYLPSVLDQHFL